MIEQHRQCSAARQACCLARPLHRCTDWAIACWICQQPGNAQLHGEAWRMVRKIQQLRGKVGKRHCVATLLQSQADGAQGFTTKHYLQALLVYDVEASSCSSTCNMECDIVAAAQSAHKIVVIRANAMRADDTSPTQRLPCCCWASRLAGR